MHGHHEQGSGHPLARDVAHIEGDSAVAQAEKVVQISRYLMRRLYEREQLKTLISPREIHGEKTALDVAGHRHFNTKPFVAQELRVECRIVEGDRGLHSNGS